MEKQIFHQENQYVRNNWMVALLLLALFIYWGVKVYSTINGAASSNYWSLGLLLLILVALSNLKQHLSFSNEEILLKISTLGISFYQKTIPVPDLATIIYQTYNPYLTGWGIRIIGRHKMGYILEGKQGVEIAQKSDQEKRIYISLKASKEKIMALIAEYQEG